MRVLPAGALVCVKEVFVVGGWCTMVCGVYVWGCMMEEEGVVFVAGVCVLGCVLLEWVYVDVCLRGVMCATD